MTGRITHITDRELALQAEVATLKTELLSLRSTAQKVEELERVVNAARGILTGYYLFTIDPVDSIQDIENVNRNIS
jgi:hypothetical protein